MGPLRKRGWLPSASHALCRLTDEQTEARVSEPTEFALTPPTTRGRISNAERARTRASNLSDRPAQTKSVKASTPKLPAAAWSSATPPPFPGKSRQRP
ncbi:hypothetical protein AAFF_G00331970 [Aldrovandia affinis]|uniref:Uncharacterized protein n=1 Tax=Aldrovandia affinis TaxID=143900 RepID=A0AAD7SLF2_9TELE|nr:hypothetical protein AAFF_G00331970 [Aldrovandia affinis]